MIILAKVMGPRGSSVKLVDITTPIVCLVAGALIIMYPKYMY